MIYHLNYGLNKTRLPVIPVEVEGKHLCFIIDTGSTCSLIDSNVKEYFKEIITPVGNHNINGIDGIKYKVDVITLPFSFEGQSFNPKFCVKPLLEAFKDMEVESGIQVHGILGTDFLIEHKWIIDFNEMQIIL
mgnify:FL=1|jgi:hypothetical protein